MTKKAGSEKKKINRKKFISQIRNLKVKENPTYFTEKKQNGWRKKAFSKTAQDSGQKRSLFFRRMGGKKICFLRFFDLYIPPIPAS